MSRLTRDGTAEPFSRGQILRRERRLGNARFLCSADHEQDWQPDPVDRNIHFPCSAEHGQDWQPYPVDPYSVICDDHTYIHTCSALISDDPKYILYYY